MIRLLTCAVILVSGVAFAQIDKNETDQTAAKAREDAIITEALSAAPPQVAETATVMDLGGKVLRQGTGAYTCFPSPPDFAGPMCLDKQFLGWMKAFMTGKAPNVSNIGLAYMLAGDSPTGGASNNDPAARNPTANNEWVVEGPHVMIIAPDEEMFAGMPTTPATEGPYVMWPGSPYAHVMWPVGKRGKQRPVSGQ